MEISTSALPTVAAERATMFVALELSKSIWLVALHSPISDKVSQHRFAGGDVDGLLALIARKQAQAEAGLGQTIRILSCYEAGYDGFWLHRLLCARGIDNRVLDAASILVDRRSRRAKTDRLDAAGLLRTLMALDRGESWVWSQDEARVGQKGRTGYVWWRRGHTPRGRRDLGHRSAWIIGAVCPRRDTGVALVMTGLDTEAMTLFLAELSQAVAPGAHAVVLMDKADWHIAGDLVVPANLSLVFLPPYSPELNPIERLWLCLRDNRLTHRVFAGTVEIIDACCDAWNALLADTGRIRSLGSYPWLEKVNA